jgi:hypothetical protein
VAVVTRLVICEVRLLVVCLEHNGADLPSEPLTVGCTPLVVVIYAVDPCGNGLPRVPREDQVDPRLSRVRLVDPLRSLRHCEDMFINFSAGIASRFSVYGQPGRGRDQVTPCL